MLGLLFWCAGRVAAEEKPVAASPAPRLIIAVGAPGSDEFEQPFKQWAERWSAAANKGGAECVVIGLAEAGDKTDHDRLQAALSAHAKGPLWLVLIGHGTFDGKVARFNLRGPDVAADELKGWLSNVETPLTVIDCSSCSGPFLTELSGSQRVIITATRSGHEYNFSRLGDFLSAAIADPSADLDKDEQTSLLEAYLLANAKLREFYAREARLATEHALLDDNGDRQGTPADWYQGLRPAKEAKSGAKLDGALASQFVLVPNPREEQLSAAIRMRRDELERQVWELRQRKTTLAEPEYLALLEPLLVELAQLGAEAAQSSPNAK
jgi:hypothetical protein